MPQPISPASSTKVLRAPSRPHVDATAGRRRVKPPGGGSGLLVRTPRASAPTRTGLDVLAGYTDATGRKREVIAGRRHDGCVLVVDRDALTFGDRRLIAHLAADEPAENAALVCAHYVQDSNRGRCRKVTVEDLIGGPCAGEQRGRSAPETDLLGSSIESGDDAYRLECAPTDSAAMELRWRRHSRRGRAVAPAIVCLREVVGACENYEPACELTCAALARYYEDANVATAVLRSELERLRESPVVLNRKLRQMVLAAVERHGLSMSEIAIRCGRIKRDSKGAVSGETSWLARRVGIFPESGASNPTPWIHTDVLALIARNGLGISPREVEFG